MGTADATHFYIYYRIDAPQAAVARRAIATLFDRLRHATGIAGRLQIKCDEPTLWMEIYTDVTDPDGFEQHLTRCAADSGLPDLLAPGSRRRIERFGDA
ncbi:MAG: DUF4936 family protein [Burkholderiales bacterium]|nr:DUF4936 family protein [Burkholderiales bacterium]